jgi:hypothetical protein
VKEGHRPNTWHNSGHTVTLENPLIALTDYLLAAASAGLAITLGRRLGPHNRVSGWYWCGAFAAAGIAAALGGSYHAFETQLESSMLRPLWNIVVFSMGACAAFIASAVHAGWVRPADGTVRWLAGGIAVTLFGAAVQQGALPSPASWGPAATFHIIQIAGMYLFFRCARTMRDRPVSPRLPNRP